MKKLAEEYALARLQGRLSGNEISFSENRVFTKEDIENAFNAGRESVVENVPKLSWSSVGPEKMSNPTLVGVYIITPLNPSFKLELDNGFVSRIVDCPFKTKKEAIQAANENYKQHIKEALGL